VSFRSYYTFEARYCTPGKGNEKGGVEGGVGFARRNFLVPLPRVESFEELNQAVVGKVRGTRGSD
jgi:transposase